MIFQPDSTTPPTAKSCVRCVEGVAADKVASRRSWPLFSSDPNPLRFFLVGHIKGQKNSNHPHRDDELKESIQPTVSYISTRKLGPLRRNMFIKRDTNLRASGNHFQHL
jgi:hypothetical protein